MKNICKAAGYLIFCALLHAGCCTQSEKPSKTRLLLDWLPNPNHIPVFAGIEMGIFAKHGIHFAIKKVQDPSDLVGYLKTGQADLILYYMPNVIRSQVKGYPLKPVGFLIKEPLNGLIYRRGEGIENPHDLTGKTIGYCVDGSTTLILDQIMKQNRITHANKKNVTFDLVSTLGTKKVDAVYGAYWNIECEHLRSLGIDTDYFPLDKLGIPTYYELMVVASNNTYTSQQEFIDRFQSALQESIDYSVAHPDEAFTHYQNANPDKTEKTLEWERQAWFKTIPVLAKDQHLDSRVWQEFATWMEEHHLLNH